MLKYGLKIWSTNKDLFQEAVYLVKKGTADFIELYTVPGEMAEKDLAIFKNVIVALHAPHETHDFNLLALTQTNLDFFNQEIVGLADFLKSHFIVTHGGVDRTANMASQDIFKENVAKIYDKRILIENLSNAAIGGGVCFGYSQEELRFIKEDCGFDLCFDFSHGSLAALSQGFDYKNFISQALDRFRPFYFHLCGSAFKEPFEDAHLNLWEGDFDVRWAKEKLTELAKEKDIWLVFEVPKLGGNLENDIKNIEFFRNL